MGWTNLLRPGPTLRVALGTQTVYGRGGWPCLVTSIVRASPTVCTTWMIFYSGVPAESDQCGLALEKATSLCDRLGLPVAAHQDCRASNCPDISRYRGGLGVRRNSGSRRRSSRNSVPFSASGLPSGMHRSTTCKCYWATLSHAATVVRPGRVFLRQLIDTAKLPRLPSHKVRLNAGCRADISWWADPLCRTGMA